MKRLTRYSLIVVLLAAIVAFVRSRQRTDPLPSVPDGSPPWPPLRDTVSTCGHSATSKAPSQPDPQESTQPDPQGPSQPDTRASTQADHQGPSQPDTRASTQADVQESGRPTGTRAPVEAPRPDSVRPDAGAGWLPPDDEGNCPEGHPIKAKLRSKIYHSPGQLNYDRTVPDRCYVDDVAAEADGLRPAKR